MHWQGGFITELKYTSKIQTNKSGLTRADFLFRIHKTDVLLWQTSVRGCSGHPERAKTRLTRQMEDFFCYTFSLKIAQWMPTADAPGTLHSIHIILMKENEDMAIYVMSVMYVCYICYVCCVCCACYVCYVCYECYVCYVMLCYAMLCYVMIRYVVLCYVMLCYVMLCYVMLCHDMLCYVMLCYIMLCCVVLCYVMLMLCCVVLCCLMLCCVMLCHVMSCHVMSCMFVCMYVCMGALALGPYAGGAAPPAGVR